MSDSLRSPLLDLPNELLILIAKELTVYKSLGYIHSLLLTNRRFSLICTPLLIQHALSIRNGDFEHRPGGTVLHWAACKGYANLVERHLAAGFDADIRSLDYRITVTPLGVAAARGYIDIMQLLISSGASIRGHQCRPSPLELAAKHGHISAIDALVTKNVYSNSREEDEDWTYLFQTVLISMLERKTRIGKREMHGENGQMGIWLYVRLLARAVLMLLGNYWITGRAPRQRTVKAPESF
jgi:hypothetical protein